MEVIGFICLVIVMITFIAHCWYSLRDEMKKEKEDKEDKAC